LLPVIGEEFEKKGNPPKPEEDVDMAQNSQSSDQSAESDPESRERFEQREKDIERDVKLMESLFQNEAAKS
jgi:hypothetical protein